MTGSKLFLHFYISVISIKLLSENELIICALLKLQYQILRNFFEPEPGFEPGTYKEECLNLCAQLNQLIAQLVDRQAKALEVRIPVQVQNFLLESDISVPTYMTPFTMELTRSYKRGNECDSF